MISGSSLLQKLAKDALKRGLDVGKSLGNCHPIRVLLDRHLAFGASIERGSRNPFGRAIASMPAAGTHQFHLRSHREPCTAFDGSGGAGQDASLWSGPRFSPARHLAGRAPLERGKFIQAVIDVAAVLSALLLVIVTGCALSASLFILFFVST